MPELAELKAGDEVAIRAGMSSEYHIYKVAKVEKRGVIELENGSRYRLNGTPLAKGEKWYRHESIVPVTDEVRKIIKKNRLVSKLNGLDYNEWKKMDVETLETVAAIIWKEQG